tara:strand:- start:28 stop:291 length:264 start_codon:yes stop_codon:yes gene_type:complete
MELMETRPQLTDLVEVVAVEVMLVILSQQIQASVEVLEVLIMELDLMEQMVLEAAAEAAVETPIQVQEEVMEPSCLEYLTDDNKCQH